MRSGVGLLLLAQVWAAPRIAPPVAAGLPVAASWASEAPTAADEYALIAGTVFRPSGHSFPGVEVTLQPEQGKAQKTRSSPRGEFSFRVPAKAGRYTVIVKAAGHRSESKPVEVHADERVDISFLMESEK